MKHLYTARVHVTGGRDGSAASSDGKLSVRLALPRALGGSGEGVNPEQLFVAGYAACFASSLKAAAAAAKLRVGGLAIDAEGVLSLRDDGSYIVSEVRLAVHSPELGGAAAVIDEARRICAYTNATRGNVITEVVLNPVSATQGASS
jgi:Ohr subfamily peroxiredoxin